MAFLEVLIILVLAKLVSSQPSVRDKTNGISFINFVQHTNRKLGGKPLRKTLASVTECLIECNVESRCLSTNINTTSDGQDLYECNLLDSDKHEYLEKFTPTKGIDHYSMPVGEHILPN